MSSWASNLSLERCQHFSAVDQCIMWKDTQLLARNAFKNGICRRIRVENIVLFCNRCSFSGSTFLEPVTSLLFDSLPRKKCELKAVAGCCWDGKGSKKQRWNFLSVALYAWDSNPLSDDWFSLLFQILESQKTHSWLHPHYL